MSSETPQYGQWQTIDTAPKDGTTVLLGWAGSCSDVGFYYRGTPRPLFTEAGWFCLVDVGNLRIADPCFPSHWMPLPDPPCEDIGDTANG